MTLKFRFVSIRDGPFYHWPPITVCCWSSITDVVADDIAIDVDVAIAWIVDVVVAAAAIAIVVLVSNHSFALSYILQTVPNALSEYHSISHITVRIQGWANGFTEDLKNKQL